MLSEVEASLYQAKPIFFAQALDCYGIIVQLVLSGAEASLTSSTYQLAALSGVGVSEFFI